MSSIIPWNNLPLEIWPIVLGQLDDVSHLATCRLVCKSWDPIAERAMFKQEYRLKPEAQHKYYKHLVKKPALAQLIRHIQILAYDNDISFYTQFLELAFTCNVKTIETPDMATEKFSRDMNNLLLRIAQRTSEDYTLEQLPCPLSWDDVYVRTLLFFKKTLTCLELDFLWSVDDDSNKIKIALLNRKNEFENLRTIKLDIEGGGSFTQLETLLRRCTSIQELELDFESAYIEEQIESKEALDEWMKHHVEKDTSVRKLHFAEPLCEPGVVYYLLYKFPRLARVEIYDWTDSDDINITLPMIEALKEVPFLSIGPRIGDSLPTLKAFISNVRSQQNTLCISGGKSSICVKKFKFLGITEFIITEQLQAMEDIISHLSAISSLDISYGMHDAWKQEGQMSSLYRVLEAVAPHIKKLTIQDMDIQCPPSSYTPPVCSHLLQLEIRGAIVNKLVLSSLSTIAPNLQYLTLNTCLLDTTACHQNYHVVMPHTDFKCLSIVTNNVIGVSEKVIAWLKQEIDIKDHQMMKLQVTTLDDQQTHYFVLKAGIPTQYKHISLEDYTRMADKWPKTVVECKSMKYIKFGLGKLMNIIINVEAAKETGRIQPLGDWNKSCQTAIVRTSGGSSTLDPAFKFFLKVLRRPNSYYQQRRQKSSR